MIAHAFSTLFDPILPWTNGKFAPFWFFFTHVLGKLGGARTTGSDVITTFLKSTFVVFGNF